MSALSEGCAGQPLALGDELAGAQDQLVAGHAASLWRPVPADGSRRMAKLDPHDVGWFPTSPRGAARWLEANHDTGGRAWVGFRPKASGLPTMTWPELVDEVLCVGWIDGVRKPVDGGSAMRITPRREGSNWSARNVGRVEALRAEGRMRAAGEAAFARRRAGPDGDLLVRAASLPSTTRRTQRSTPRTARPRVLGAASRTAIAGSATHWVMSAKRPETAGAAPVDAGGGVHSEASACRGPAGDRGPRSRRAVPEVLSPRR